MSNERLSVILSAGLTLFLTVSVAAKTGSKARKSGEELPQQGNAVLWRSPDDIKSRNLFYGAGGEEHAPHTVYTFEKEDLEGTNPKFTVRDENGVRWKVKMGQEARPETAASRLVWAVGYSTDEDYFLQNLHVEGMPKKLHRGQNYVGPNGTLHDVRLKRYLAGEKKVGIWHWHDNLFNDTKELSGLKVMMALINNWDVKDENNAIFRKKHSDGMQDPEDIYRVSDLGASFGTTGFNWTQSLSKGNLEGYTHSRLIGKATPEYVDFNMPTRAAVIHIFTPPEYIRRLELRWVGKHIPVEDVRWIAQLLGQLSHDQIRDAFRAAGYPPEEIEGFAQAVEKRIAELRNI